MTRLHITCDTAALAACGEREALVGCYLLAMQSRWPDTVPWNVWQAAAVTRLWRSEVERGLDGLIQRGLVVVATMKAA